ncbi:hypothetical protein L1049_000099 [Liquidambar formosana]|uniref:Uncharacterized protein n=1 Tax=Liquidambar formosana TaxID=63359 RepID=A0AAP0R4K7_LIQFO
MWDGDTRNREGADWSMSRYKTSRFPSNEYQVDRGWGNGRGRKRVNFVYERPYVDKKPASRQWNMMNSCQPLNHGSGKAQDSWSWEKLVSLKTWNE